MTSQEIQRTARECGFDLAGVAGIETRDFDRYQGWAEAGYAGKMGYLTDHRAELRRSAKGLLENARSVICVGKLYNTRPEVKDPPISRYAWGDDYHVVMKTMLERLTAKLQEREPFDYKICVDTAPLLERSLAREAGLGWIGKNTCLINEPLGSWFFLGEIITSLALTPDTPPPDRCGTCTRCIEACPTQAILPEGGLDARRCISYLTIELRGPIPVEHHAGIGQHVFGCDICQEVCPWNSRAPVTELTNFEPRAQLSLDAMASIDKADFQAKFDGSPVLRARFDGFRRNLQIALANRDNKIV